MINRLFRRNKNKSWIDGALNIKSQVSGKELLLLYKLSKEVECGCVVEIGSHHGRSTVALCHGTKDGYNVPIYAIEPHENFTGIFGGQFGPQDRVEFFKNMLINSCVEQVRLVNLSSEIVAPNWNMEVGLLWIDGDHSYEGVARDYNCWKSKVKNKGFIAFHDSLDKEAGPYKLIQELVENESVEIVDQVDLITVVQLLVK